MNKVGYFLIGLLTGTVVTYFVMQYLWNKRLDRELESTEKYYESKIMDISKIENETKEEGGEENPLVVEVKVEKKEESEEENLEEEFEQYTNKIKNLEYGFVPSNDNDRDIHFAERESPKEDDLVYRIDGEDFFNDNADYDKISLQYYTEDHVFVDDQCEPIDNIMHTLGLVDWPEKDSEEDVIYIRNDSLGVDFEISKVYSSYGEDVLGLGKEDLL